MRTIILTMAGVLTATLFVIWWVPGVTGWLFGTPVETGIQSTHRASQQPSVPSTPEPHPGIVPTPVIPEALPALITSIAQGGWQEIAVDDVDHLPRLRDDVEGERLLLLQRDRLAALQPGDVLALPIPQLEDAVDLWVDAVSRLPSGNLSISGSVDGNPAYGVVMTLGERATFATVGTPAGVFNLRGNTSHAWIIPARALNHHVDPAIPDYRLPADRRNSPAAGSS